MTSFRRGASFAPIGLALVLFVGTVAHVPPLQAAELTPYADLSSCPFQKRDAETRVLADRWHLVETGIEMFREHPLVRGADYTQAAVAIIDSGLSVKKNAEAGPALEALDRRETTDVDGHGTLVAGTIASPSFGVNPRLPLVVEKVDEDAAPSTLTASVTNALQRVGRNPSVHVVHVSTISLGDPAVRGAVQELVRKGVWLSYPAGNETAINAHTNEVLHELALLPEIIAVGALNFLGTPSSFTVPGGDIDLFAPGVQLESLRSTAVRGTKEKDSAYWGGTAAAAAYTSGVLGTLRAIDPSLTGEQLRRLVAESSLVRGSGASTAAQLNPLLLIEHVGVLRRARESASCSEFEDCLALAKTALRGALDTRRKALVAPQGTRCEEWKEFRDQALEGYLLSRGLDGTFSDALTRIALSRKPGDGAETVYYATPGTHQKRLAKWVGTKETAAEVAAAKEFLARASGSRSLASAPEAEATAANLDRLWAKCSAFYFELPTKSVPPVCGLRLGSASMDVRAGLAQRILNSDRPVLNGMVVFQDWFKLRDHDRQKDLFKRLRSRVLAAYGKASPPLLIADDLFPELAEMSNEERLTAYALVQRLEKKSAKHTIFAIYADPEADEPKRIAWASELRDAAVYPGAVADLAVLAHRAAAGYAQTKETATTLREFFAAWEPVDTAWGKQEEASGKSARATLDAYLDALAANPMTIGPFGQVLLEGQNVATLGKLLSAHKGDFSPRWVDALSKVAAAMIAIDRSTLALKLRGTWIPRRTAAATTGDYFAWLTNLNDMEGTREIFTELTLPAARGQFDESLRLAYLRQRVGEATTSVPEVHELLAEMPGGFLSAAPFVPVPVAASDAAYREALRHATDAAADEYAAKRPLTAQAGRVLWNALAKGDTGTANFGSSLLDVLVPHLSIVVVHRPRWDEETRDTESATMRLGTWSLGDDERRSRILDELGRALTDQPFFDGEDVAPGPAREAERQARRRGLAQMVVDLSADPEGERWLAKHPVVQERVVSVLTQPTERGLAGARLPRVLAEAFRKKLPTPDEWASAERSIAWVPPFVARDRQSIVVGAELLSARHDLALSDALRIAAHRYASDLTEEEKNALDLAVGRTRPPLPPRNPEVDTTYRTEKFL